MESISLQQISVSKLANHVQAMSKCNDEFKQFHQDAIDKMCELLPHGSGIDGKFELQPELCNEDKLTFFFEFHHIDDNGFYCGWTEHNLIITPSLIFGFKMRITGKDKRDIKSYLYDLFSDIFSA